MKTVEKEVKKNKGTTHTIEGERKRDGERIIERERAGLRSRQT